MTLQQIPPRNHDSRSADKRQTRVFRTVFFDIQRLRRVNLNQVGPLGQQDFHGRLVNVHVVHHVINGAHVQEKQISQVFLQVLVRWQFVSYDIGRSPARQKRISGFEFQRAVLLEVQNLGITVVAKFIEKLYVGGGTG